MLHPTESTIAAFVKVNLKFPFNQFAVEVCNINSASSIGVHSLSYWRITSGSPQSNGGMQIIQDEHFCLPYESVFEQSCSENIMK